MNTQLILRGTLETLYMTATTVFLSSIIGLLTGVALAVTSKNGLWKNLVVHGIIEFVVNVVRSIPFLILLVAVMPITRFITGSSIGTNATIVPLVIGSAPFIARLVESSLLSVDVNLIEAALSIGLSRFSIIIHILAPAALPLLILDLTTSTTTILGYSAMAGFVGGGGLGDIAIRFGYHRYQHDVMVITVLILVIIVQIIQEIGNFFSKKLNKLWN